MAAITTQDIDLGGNDIICNSIDIGATVPGDPTVGVATIFAGVGAPAFQASQGSLYLRTDGGASTRLYSNTSGSTTWSAITSA